MGSDEADLRRAWRRWLPGEPDAVIARYRETHRRYHGVRHLARVVGDVTRLLGEVHVDDSAVVIAAAFFHDAVYDPTSSTNEADSARLAATSLAPFADAGWDAPRRAEVQRLVLATGGHFASDAADGRGGGDDSAAAVLLDADLAILGAEPAVYGAYVLGVRSEYAHVDDEAWRVGRAAVLRSFLDRAVIYRTAPMRALEGRARANLAAELASLS